MPYRVSLAKLDRNAEATVLSMSPRRIKKRSGPRTDHWGTPDFTSDTFECSPFTITVWLRPVRKE